MKLFSNPQWIKSGIFSIGSRFSTLFFGFGSLLCYVRFLDKSEFAALSLFLTVTTILEMSRNGLIQNALIKLMHSHGAHEINKVVTASWVLNIVFSAISFLIILIASPFFTNGLHLPQLTQMFLVYGFTMILLIPFSQFNYMQQAHLSFSGIFWSAFARQGTFFVANFVIWEMDLHPPAIYLVLILTGCTFIGLVVAFVLARKFVNFKFEWDMPTTKKVFQFGKWVMGTNICSLLYKSVDQFTIGYFLNPVGVASYASAMRLSNLIEYPATSVAEVVYPHSTMRISQSGEQVVKNIYEKSLALTIAITLPLVVVTFLFADIIMYIVAGPQYVDSADILRVTILFGIFTPFNRQFGMVMDSAGRPHQNFLLLVFALILNIVVNIIFVKAFGLMGAAYGTLLSYFILAIAGNYILVKLFNVEMKNVFVNMFDYYKQGLFAARQILKGNLKFR